MTRRRFRTRFAIATAAIAGAAILALSSSAGAAPLVPTPDAGPIAGGTTVLVPEPVGLVFTQVAQGPQHALAIGSDGGVYAWGSNSSGQLGDGTSTNRTTPVRALTPAGITFTAVNAGYNWSLAIGSDGQVYSWGVNGFGQLGNGTTTGSSVPVLVATPPGVTFSSVGSGEYSNAALGSDGQVYVWGRVPPANTVLTTPVAVSPPAGLSFTRLSVGNGHFLAVASDGTGYAWGNNGFGQFGNGTTTPSATPTPVSMPPGVALAQISSGGYFSTAIGSDGLTYSWGYNADGQLGDGTTTTRSSPGPVPTPAGVALASLDAGYNHVLAFAADGTAWAWGGNLLGQLGIGNNVNQLAPVPVSVPASVEFTAMSASDQRSAALDARGRIFRWTAYEGTNVPTLFVPVSTVTRITFDGIDGSSLTDLGDGSWSAVTPAHAAGPVDVVVEWTRDGAAQTPVVFVDGFTYLDQSVTDPADATTTVGTPAVFAVTTSGMTDPIVDWEVSTDGGTTWAPISSDPDAVVAADGLSVTVTPSSVAHDGHRYRAIATDDLGSVTSGSALLTVIANGGGSGGGPSTGGLPATGSGSPTPVAAVGGALVLLGLAAAAVALRARRRA